MEMECVWLPAYQTEAGDAPEIGLPYSILTATQNKPDVTHTNRPVSSIFLGGFFSVSFKGASSGLAVEGSG